MQSASYSEYHAQEAGLTLGVLEMRSWLPRDVRLLQRRVGAKPDGWFGPKTIRRWRAWAGRNRSDLPQPAEPLANPRTLILGGAPVAVPVGVQLINHQEPEGVPARPACTERRSEPVCQFVLHRGAQVKGRRDVSYAHATERILDNRGLSTTFSLDVDGTLYQHFDPAVRSGRHCAYHNGQSDSLDICGPFSRRRAGLPGQEELTLRMAIGRRNDGRPPLDRRYAPVRCHSMTPEQVDALVEFLPWYCRLRGIPAAACSDWRTFRLSGGLGRRDPVTAVPGIIAHAQVAAPGTRVDGILPLHHLLETGADISWRKGEEFVE